MFFFCSRSHDSFPVSRNFLHIPLCSFVHFYLYFYNVPRHTKCVFLQFFFLLYFSIWQNIFLTTYVGTAEIFRFCLYEFPFNRLERYYFIFSFCRFDYCHLYHWHFAMSKVHCAFIFFFHLYFMLILDPFHCCKIVPFFLLLL